MNQEAAPQISRGAPLVDVAGMSAFVAVVNSASFTGAARKLGTSKSVISRRISEIERHLGARLIDRSAARVTPTEIGSVYYARCVQILESIEAANDFVAGFNGDIRGTLRVSVPRYFCECVAAPALTEFAGKYPDLRVEIDVEERDADLRDTGFDIAVRIGQLPDSSMISRAIGSTGTWLCASPGYLQHHGVPETPDELEQHACLMHSGGELLSGWVLRCGGKTRLYRVRERLRSACYLQLLDAVVAGLGIALLPGYLIADAVATDQVRVVMQACAPPHRPISVVYPPGRRKSPKVQALADFLAERIPRPSAWELQSPGL